MRQYLNMNKIYELSNKILNKADECNLTAPTKEDAERFQRELNILLIEELWEKRTGHDSAHASQPTS